MVKTIYPSVDIIPTKSNSTLINVLKHIEFIGRVCYKSENLITNDSYKKFVTMILNRGHETVIEHSNFILTISENIYNELKKISDKGMDEVPLFIRMSNDKNGCLISGNMRVFRSFFHHFYHIANKSKNIIAFLKSEYPIFFENLNINHSEKDGILLFNDFDFMSISEKRRHLTVTAKFICNRGVSHEIVRHKQNIVFSQESTRYCDYQKSKFGNEIKVVLPVKVIEGKKDELIWKKQMESAEKSYFNLRKNNWSPQLSRGTLPIDVKTEIIVTATLWEWDNIFYRRTSQFAHPDTHYLMSKLYDLLKKELSLRGVFKITEKMHYKEKIICK